MKAEGKMEYKEKRKTVPRTIKKRPSSFTCTFNCTPLKLERKENLPSSRDDKLM